jgi:rare lipoprotein A
MAVTVFPLFAFQTGHASWYGGKFQGRLTANGERFDTNKHTAAHRTLPFGTRVRVTNLDNGKSTVVRINDRGPFIQGRIIDLSRAAAEELDMIETGTAPVRIEIVHGEPSSGEPVSVQHPPQPDTPKPEKHAKQPSPHMSEESTPATLEEDEYTLPQPEIKDPSPAHERSAGAVEPSSGTNPIANDRAGTNPDAHDPAAADPTSPDSAAPQQQYYNIQVGAFSVPDNALKLKRKLEAKGFSPAFEPAAGQIVRVILPDISAEELPATRMRLEKVGIHDILVKTTYR